MTIWDATVNTRRPYATDSAQNPTTSPTGPLAAFRPIELTFKGLEVGAATEATSTSSQEHTHSHNGKDIELANHHTKDSCSLLVIYQPSYYQYHITQSSPVVFRGSLTHSSVTQDPNDTYICTPQALTHQPYIQPYRFPYRFLIEHPTDTLQTCYSYKDAAHRSLPCFPTSAARLQHLCGQKPGGRP